MKERLILSASAIRSTGFDIERPARNIARAMVDEGFIKVKQGKWIKDLLAGRKSSYPLLTMSQLEKEIESSIESALSFDFKKHVAIGTRKFRWTEPTSDSDGFMEFFYKEDFQQKVSGKGGIYYSHPYTREMLGYWDDSDYVSRIKDIVKYDSSILHQEVYELAMPSLVQGLSRYKDCLGSLEQSRFLVALEKVVTSELYFVPSKFEDAVLAQTEFREL